jgi:hypothetical protein
MGDENRVEYGIFVSGGIEEVDTGSIEEDMGDGSDGR